jgi:hypothetical protein
MVEVESIVEPNGIRNNFCREAMALACIDSPIFTKIRPLRFRYLIYRSIFDATPYLLHLEPAQMLQRL